LIDDYIKKQTLRKLGMVFDNLSDFEIEYLTFIDNEFKRLGNESLKKKKVK